MPTMRRESPPQKGKTVVTDPGIPGVVAGKSVLKDPGNPSALSRAPFEGNSGGLHIDASVTSAHALRYAQGAQQRLQANLKQGAGVPNNLPKYTPPVAGGKPPPIPRLDSKFQEGRTMSETALMSRGEIPIGTPGAFMGAHPPPIASPPSPENLGAGVALQLGDTLPQAAQQDPLFRQGHGSMFAANQDLSLARKYGVVRKGVHIAPQALSPVSGQTPQLSKQTLEGLEELKRFDATRARAESGQDEVDKQVEAEARRGPASGVGATEPPLSEKEKKDLLEEMDDFDLNRLRNALFKDLLNNDEQKKIIEDRLKPLNLTEMVIEGRVTQVVPIVPGTFEPEYQSYSAGEDMLIKRLVAEERQGLDLPDRYMLDKFSLMGLTIAVRGINNVPLPDYRDANGVFDREAFWKKYEIISGLNYHMVGSLSVNWFWFDMRVRKLLVATQVGNG